MPKRMDHHATILKKLQDFIKHSDPAAEAGRRFAIERWVKTYIRQVEYLKDNELQFLYHVFRDDSCWSGTSLNNAMLGQKLTEETICEVENPLSKYDMACRYCVVDKIQQFFQEQLEYYKASFSPNAVDNDGGIASNNAKYIRNDLLDSMDSYDPVFSLWIDRESGVLKEYSNIDGFQEAIKLKWIEGTEYFYKRLNEQEREKEAANAIISLSTIQCNYKCATILDFCLQELGDSTKHQLFLKLLEKKQGVYTLLNGLIRWCFLDKVQDIVKRWCYEESSVQPDKILSHNDYALLLSSLANVVLENPELSVQARSMIMDIWKCDRFSEHKKTAIFSNGRVRIKRVFAGLVVDLERDCNVEKKGETKDQILEILQLAKEGCSAKDFESFKNYVINNVRTVGRAGMKEGFNYSKLVEELFSELDNACQPYCGSHQQSVLGDPKISGIPGRSK